MKLLASIKFRLFLVCWILFSTFFATNVVREHYPAFALLDRGDFVCDRYAGFHADIFQHTDGHWYVGNNVLGSVIAAVPLAIFDPVLDRLEAASKAKLAESPNPPEPVYDTKYPNRQKMWRKVVLAGLDLRFAASTVITSVFLMAPLSALFAVIVYSVFLRRGVDRKRSIWLALLFAFGTPIFYRTAHLNHNMFLMEALFGAFVVAWMSSGEKFALSLNARAVFGVLLGTACALDYAGFVPAAVVFFYWFATRARAAGLVLALRETPAILCSGAPFIAFLLWTQWLMYGNAFTPGQMVMPQQNEFVVYGNRGMGWPHLEVFVKNLVAPGWGLYTFGPLLLVALWPTFKLANESELVFPRRERCWAFAFVLATMLFSAANWYSLLQYNTGFRYLLPVVPFAFLQASDHLVRMKTRTLAVISVLVIAHGTVLSMAREVNDVENEIRHQALELKTDEWNVPDYWHRMATETPIPVSYERVFATEGPQLPWLTVARQTQPQLKSVLGNPLVPIGVIAFALALCAAIWKLGEKSARAAA